jgi:hypothetical protein
LQEAADFHRLAIPEDEFILEQNREGHIRDKKFLRAVVVVIFIIFCW